MIKRTLRTAKRRETPPRALEEQPSVSPPGGTAGVQNLEKGRRAQAERKQQRKAAGAGAAPESRAPGRGTGRALPPAMLDKGAESIAFLGLHILSIATKSPPTPEEIHAEKEALVVVATSYEIPDHPRAPLIVLLATTAIVATSQVLRTLDRRREEASKRATGNDGDHRRQEPERKDGVHASTDGGGSSALGGG